VVDAVSELLSDYNFREDSSLEIDDSEEGYILQIRKPYQHLVNKMIPMDISTAALRTLSVIAIKSPLLQKDLIELRGASAYDHVKELLSHKLISKNRSGVSYRLNVTPTFHQLFKLSGDKKDLDVLVESELGLEKEQRQQALKAPLEDITSLDDLALSVSLDD
jgi:segregation and condensation protein B